MCMCVLQVSAAVKSQQDFLELLRSSSPVSNISSSTSNHHHVAASSTMLGRPAAAAFPPAAPASGSPGHVLVYPIASAASSPHALQQLGSLATGWHSNLAGLTAGPASAFLSAGASPVHPAAAQGPAAADSIPAVMLLQQLAQLQHLVAHQQQQQQPAANSQQGQQQSPQARDAASTRRRGSRVSGRDKGRLQQQLAKHLQQHSSQPLHVRQGSAAQPGLCGISRVSSDLTQMLALSASGDSEGTTEKEEEGRSVGWDE